MACYDVYNLEYDLLFKVILLGDQGVGKTSILTRFEKNKFDLESKPTIVIEFAMPLISVDDQVILAQTWDTSGDERLRPRLGPLCRGALGAWIVYDITRKVTFENVEKWLKKLREHVDQTFVIMLVGNKADLHHLRDVQTEEGMAFAERENMFFMETSALESLNVNDAFVKVVTQLYNNFNNKRQDYFNKRKKAREAGNSSKENI